MDAARFADYDRTRSFTGKAVRALCYAAHTNLYFDRIGRVQACCWNWSEPAGNITQNSLDEIWHGAKLAALRASLADYQFSSGCDFCAFQSAEGFFGGAKMRNFDRFPVPSALPEWPQQMELSISNACNLECVMCDGDHSSAIRAQREKRPAMPRLYTDEILESFRKYLPHVQQVKFLGGEPFLAVEHYKLWDMMLEDGLKTMCHVTTNGSQYNARIENLLGKLPFGFAISFDGVTRQTIERVRVNTDYDELMRNTQRFRNHARDHKTQFALTYCLMLPNWQEFGDFCLMADAWDCPVGVNTVRRPAELSLYKLPISELRKIFAQMERQAVSLESQLGRNKAVWFDEFERIRRKCATEETPAPAPRKAPSPNAFVLAVTGEAQLDAATPALHFLKKFSQAGIIVLQTRTNRRMAHDHVVDVPLPAEWSDTQAATHLKTHALQYLQSQAQNFCFLDASTVTLAEGIDDLFTQPAGFPRRTESIDTLSPATVNCNCHAPCNHLREALLCTFGIDIPQCDWQPWDDRMFHFNAASAPFLAAWDSAFQKIANDPYWKNPALGALAATVWQLGLSAQAPTENTNVRLEEAVLF